MIKVKKYDLGGFTIENLSGGADLKALSLKKYDLGDSELFGSGYFQLLNVYSKISAIDENFSVMDFIPPTIADLDVSAKYSDSIIYIQHGKYDLYHCTASDNEYKVISASYSAKKYGDVFVIEEDTDKDKKVTVFDTLLNPIKFETIAFTTKNEYEAAETEINDKRNNEIKKLNAKYPCCRIRHTEKTKNAVFEQRDFAVVCYDRKDTKCYLVKFAEGRTEVWRKEVSENLMTENILQYGDCYYCLYDTDKIGHKWHLEKLSSNGETLDTYDFKGADAILTEHYGKPVIVYMDLAQFEPWQKILVRKHQGYFGPSALLVVEE